MNRLALLRHGVAEDAGPRTGWQDGPRELTAQGRTRMITAARGIAALDLGIDVILTSPLARCHQTAEIVGGALGVNAMVDERLRPGLDLNGLVDLLLEWPDAQAPLVCGHQPDLSLLTADLVGGLVEFKKGALALIEVPVLHERAGHLVALYPPAALRRLGG